MASKTSVMNLKINSFTLDWDEDTKRKPKECFNCRALTQGRATFDGVKKIACVGCAIGETARAAREVLHG